MTQIKIFSTKYASLQGLEPLEKIINLWLEIQTDIEVLNVSFSFSEHIVCAVVAYNTKTKSALAPRD